MAVQLTRASAAGSWQLVASGNSTGKLAIAEASVPGIESPANHHAIRITATSTPAMKVEISWDLDCGNNHRGGGSTVTGSFTKTFASAPGCSADLDADLATGTGTVRVAIYAR